MTEREAVGRACFACAAIALLSIAANSASALEPAGPVTATEDGPTLTTDEAFFAPVLGDIEESLQGIADVAGMTRHLVPGASPHLVLFVEGDAGTPAFDHPVLHTVRAVCENHQLALEAQTTLLDDGAVLFGLIVYKPFPTLEFCWEVHPFESVAAEQGAWVQPVADLADVERVETGQGQATLVLGAAAARRIDRLSERHGHRVIRLRARLLPEVVDLGTYTWVPGIRRLPGVQEFIRGQFSPPDTASVQALHALSRVHAEARERVRAELGLPDDLSWTLSEGAPRYREPFLAWAVHAPEDGGSATPVPWFSADQTVPRRWQRLAPPMFGNVVAPIPRHWRLSVTGGATGILPSPPDSALASAQEEGFSEMLRENLGRELAVVMQGAVVGLFSAAERLPGALTLTGVPPSANGPMAALWGAANAGAPVAPGSVAPVARKVPEPRAAEVTNPFQVRLMAEPQDRELIPVTHFAAPGAAEGVVVAVQNDIILDGRAVTGAMLETRAGGVYLNLSLTPEAQEALEGACFCNLGKQLAIVYDGRLLCAPTILEWENVALSFKGQARDWPEVAARLVSFLTARG